MTISNFRLRVASDSLTYGEPTVVIGPSSTVQSHQLTNEGDYNSTLAITWHYKSVTTTAHGTETPVTEGLQFGTEAGLTVDFACKNGLANV